MKRLENDNEIKSIVDFGCGTGYSTPLGKDCLGIDVSPAMISVAKLTIQIKTLS